MVVRITEAVPGGRRAQSVAYLLLQGECPLAVLQRTLVLPIQRTQPADAVEGVRLSGGTLGQLVQLEGPLGVGERLSPLAARLQRPADVHGYPGLAHHVVEPTEEVQRTGIVALG